MSKHVKALMFLMAILIGSPAFSQAPTDAFSTCLGDSLTGKERKNLAKWIFFAIGAHPELKSYSNVSSNDIKAIDEYTGRLITRLLTVDCPGQLKAAYSRDPASVQIAFEMVGRVAMQELMTSQEVQKAVTNYAKFADTEKIQKALSSK
jgi:hypothetical protein